MPYVTGGLAITEIDATYSGGPSTGLFTQSGEAIPIGTTSLNTVRGGWALGGGGEVSIGRSNWTMKVEYLFMDFGHVSGVASGVAQPFSIFCCISSGAPTTITHRNSGEVSAITHITDQVLRVGLNYKFNL